MDYYMCGRDALGLFTVVVAETSLWEAGRATRRCSRCRINKAANFIIRLRHYTPDY